MGLRSLVPIAALAALAGCSEPAAESCPGVLLATLALHGVRDDAATGCAVPPAGGWIVPATVPDRAPTEQDPVPTFNASFRWDAATGTLAYCTGQPHAAVLLGTRTGDHLRAEVTLGGAVLGACSVTCQPLTTVVVEGDLTDPGDGSPAAFAGAMTETFDGGAGPCAPCQLPCTSRYTLAGTEVQ